MKTSPFNSRVARRWSPWQVSGTSAGCKFHLQLVCCQAEPPWGRARSQKRYFFQISFGFALIKACVVCAPASGEAILGRRAGCRGDGGSCPGLALLHGPSLVHLLVLFWIWPPERSSQGAVLAGLCVCVSAYVWLFEHCLCHGKNLPPASPSSPLPGLSPTSQNLLPKTEQCWGRRHPDGVLSRVFLHLYWAQLLPCSSGSWDRRCQAVRAALRCAPAALGAQKTGVLRAVLLRAVTEAT